MGFTELLFVFVCSAISRGVAPIIGTHSPPSPRFFGTCRERVFFVFSGEKPFWNGLWWLLLGFTGFYCYVPALIVDKPGKRPTRLKKTCFKCSISNVAFVFLFSLCLVNESLKELEIVRHGTSWLVDVDPIKNVGSPRYPNPPPPPTHPLGRFRSLNPVKPSKTRL